MSSRPNPFVNAGYSSPGSISPHRNYVNNNEENPQSKSPYVPPYQNGKRTQQYISPTFLSGDCFYPQPPSTLAKAPATPTKSKQNYYEKSRRTTNQATTPKSVTPRSVLQSSPLTPSIRSEKPSLSNKSASDKINDYINQVAQLQQQKTPTHSHHSSNKLSNKLSDASSSKISEMVCPDCFNKEMVTAKKKREQIKQYNDRNYIEAITHIDQTNLQREKEKERKIKAVEQQLIKEQYEDYLKLQKKKNLEKAKENEEQRKLDEATIKKEREKKFMFAEQEKIKREQFLEGIKRQIQERDEKKKKLFSNIENQNNRTFEIGKEQDEIEFLQQKKEYEKQMLREQRDQKLREKELQKRSFDQQQKQAQLQLANEIEQYELKVSKSYERVFRKKNRSSIKRKVSRNNCKPSLTKLFKKTMLTKQEVQFISSSKQKEKEQDKDYYQHIQQLDNFEKQKQQIEISRELLKKQQFIQGLNEQTQEKFNRQAMKTQWRQTDLPFVDLNRSYDFLSKPSEFTSMGKCEECSKSCLKDYLTKIHKAKNPKNK